MTVQTSYMTRRAMSRLDRSNYREAGRHSVRVVTWATDPVNIGGMVRTAEAFMAERVHCIKPPRVASVGTERWQPVDSGWDLAGAISEARDDGYTIVVLEQTSDSVMLPCALPERMCLVSGNEGSGVPQSVLDVSDMRVEIPQFGFVGSLNVVTATSIALYEWASQWANAPRPRG